MSQGELRRKRNSRNSMSPSHSAIYLYCVGQATQLHICYIYIYNTALLAFHVHQTEV